MKIAVVDFHTVDMNGDLDVSALLSLGDVGLYGRLSGEEVVSVARDCDALIVNNVAVGRDILDGCPRLRYVGTCSTGYDHVDVEECSRRGITVCNVAGYSSDAVSQHVFALLLTFVGKTYEYIDSVRRGDWEMSTAFCYAPWGIAELSGKTFGVLGYGAIGRRVARIAEGFGMDVRVSSQPVPDDCPYPLVPTDELFSVSDYLSLHCPLSRDTAHIVNERTLGLMKHTAVLINTARGGLIDEQALSRALDDGRIGGACLDTLAEEPPRGGSPLLGARNCIVTPHMAWTAKETRQRLVDIVTDNLRAFIEGHPNNMVN